MRPRKDAIDTLIQFSRLLAGAAAPAEVLPLLARAAVEQVGAGGAAVVEITTAGARISAGLTLPEALASWTDDDAVIGPELGQKILAACAGRFARAHVLPMVSGGDLFGALVLLFERDEGLEEDQLDLAEGLVDLAATGLGKAAQYDALSRSYAELRASREVLRQSHKLRALGQMAAGVSHDLKNILNPLSLHLQFLKRGLPKQATDAHESIAEMQQVLRRGVETIERLREFSRQSPVGEAAPVDLDELTHEAVEICRPRIRSRHDVQVDLHEELGGAGRVLLHEAEGVSMIVNLIVNAIEAMVAGGDVTVATGREDGGGWVRVADTGPGMAPEVQQRVFEPFFTTKGAEGTGLGLAMVYATVQRHGGRLTLKTAPGEGAAFTIWLPG